MFQPSRGCWRTCYLSLMLLPRHLKSGERGTAVFLSDTRKCSLSTFQTEVPFKDTTFPILHKSFYMSQVKNTAANQQNWIESSNLKLHFKTSKARDQVKQSQKMKIINWSSQSKRSQKICES